MTNSLVKVFLTHCRALPYTYVVSNHLMQQAAQGKQSVQYDSGTVLGELKGSSGVSKRFLPGNEQSLSSLSNTVAVQLGCFDFTDVVEINIGDKKYYLNKKTMLQKAQKLNGILERVTPLADDVAKLKEPLADIDRFKNAVLGSADDMLPFKAEIELLFKIINESSSVIKNQVAQEFKGLTRLPLGSTEQAEGYFTKYFELRQKLISQFYNGDTKALGSSLLNRLSLSNIDSTIDEASNFFTVSNPVEATPTTDSNLDHEKINRFRKYFSTRLRTLKELRHTSTRSAVESALNGLSEIDGEIATIRATKIISGVVLPKITRFIREEVIEQDYETFKRRASTFCNGEMPHEDTMKQVFQRIKEEAPGAIEGIEKEAVELSNRNVVTGDEIKQYKKDCIQLTSKISDLVILYTHGLNDNLRQAVREELVELPSALYTYVQDYSHLIAAVPLIGLLSHISKDSFDAASSLVTAAANGNDVDAKAVLPIVAQVLGDIPASRYGQLAKKGISILQNENTRKLIATKADIPEEVLAIVGNSGDLIEQIVNEPAVGKLQQKICNHFAAGGSLEKEDLVKLIGEEDVEDLVKVLSKYPDIFLKILSLQKVKDGITSSVPSEISQEAVKALLEDEQVIKAIISNPSLHKIAKLAVVHSLLKEGEKDISSILNSIEQKDVSSLLGLIYKHQKLKALLPNDKKIIWGGRLVHWALNGTLRNVALGIGGLISLGGLYLIRDDLTKGILNGIGSVGFGATLAAFAKRTLVSKFLKMEFEDGWLNNTGGWGVAGASALLGIGSYAVSEHKFKGLLPAFGFGVLGVILGSSSNTASSIVGFPSKLKGYSGNDGLAFQILKNTVAESFKKT
ncbi:MAG: hypothetical protein A3F80_09455 [Candidatus Melainabacteria bacterium RIFCSPLOWO2_12_FULL_35_11]|nr:MAG: hypothetical protein A3F80_09455 [Candidatus Melainabacteria bacterium RIFCSPLOWO2_12_FULL_35_11]